MIPMRRRPPSLRPTVDVDCEGADDVDVDGGGDVDVVVV